MDPMVHCYCSTARIVLNADCTDPSTWQELNTLLPVLRKHLSCRVCGMLVDRPNSYFNGFACSVCVNSRTAVAEPEDVLLLQNYKKMCINVVQSASLYGAMCARDEDSRLVALLNEVTRPANGRHNGMVNGGAAVIMQEANSPSIVQQPCVQIEIVNVGLETLDVQSEKRTIENQPKPNVIPTKKKRNERRSGCRCGRASSFPGKLTCFGQRCPCYTEQRSCDQCKCRGCRNPRQKRSNNDDDNGQLDQIRRKPVTLELVSSLKPSNIKSKPTFSSHDMQDMLQFSSVDSMSYEHVGAEVTLGHVNSIFHSP